MKRGVIIVGGVGSLLWIGGCFMSAPLKSDRGRPRPVTKGPTVDERDLSKPPAPVPGTGEDVPDDRITPPAASAPATPARTASQRLVEAGHGFLDSAEFERALYKFEEAINIDPSNGEAYYYMARVQTELGAYDEAEGLLDKAETLLGAGPPWDERIGSLRQQIGQGE